MRSSGSLPLTGQSETPCDEDPDFNWSVDAQADNTPGLYVVTVTISRPRSDGSAFKTQLSQYVLDPTLRGATDGSDQTDTTATTTTTGGQ